MTFTNARARSLLRQGGERLAEFDSRPGSHRLLVKAVGVAIPRRFDPDQAHDLDATFELRVRDPRGAEPARFELRVLEGRCQVRSGAARDPGAVATLGADDMIRLASGAVGWPALLANGRLELSGDPFLALRVPMLFRLPAAAVSG